MGELSLSEDTEEFWGNITKEIMKTTSLAIPRVPTLIKDRKSKPWWTKECDKIIKERNKVSKNAKFTLNGED